MRLPSLSRRARLLAAGLVAVALQGLYLPAADAANPSIERQLDSIRHEIDAPDSDAGDASLPDPAPDTGVPAQKRNSAAGPSSPTDSSPASRPTEDNAGFSTWRLYRDPVLAALIAGGILGLLGVYVVSRRIVFVSAALSQVSALGITLGFLLVASAGLGGVLQDLVPPTFAILLSLLVVFGLTGIDDTPGLPRDALLGAAFVIPMALVLVLGPYIPQEMHEIETILHGSAVVVRTGDLWAIAAAGLAILASQLLAFRAFMFATLDPTVAKTQGLPVAALEAVLFASIALMTGLVTRTLGALPAFALTVLPAIGAIRLELGLGRVFAVASGLGAAGGAGGYWLAYHLDWSVGASQTLLAAALMIATRSLGAALASSD